MVGTKPLPDDLNAILSHMQGKQIVQRKIARKSSKNTIRSLWSRKSTKKSPESGPIVTAKSTCMDDSQQIVDPEDSLNGQPELSDTLHSILSRSIIPDPLGELPAWFKKESDMAAANMSTYRIKYPLHNPLGPRWYKNHHLIPPAQLNPGNRPPSFFSPSFPPMASAISHDPSEETTRVPDPSKTPSGSPLPTPSSSQVRIPDIERISRSRKTSQDNVDMLDVSDPWGTHWHHQSPYDAGSNTSPISVDTSEASAL
ncbi:hypothetical protein SERLA73DRAFT_68331 [Serpula lacrymans var. lacrymans S7.3]|uniref:Uncharacterized protein n=2 Tax=Serpula lacrymans var. lacrymans TaxID=341189 RepID=F8PI68_SERL3|nr:uncharacterized protein SERLADRAFT_432077 [Serpula lacrymans var. lacrymans S7.9]EGO04646.1 hypothetical protein SERLA73DRAFT_68331 [Serpula lacrymans var. lacrymans S7.3]EGO30505.1 hypothetical protein SERLADRAFT_432077 [Serpula lacrymans var. lacrymans S7.9]